jgi:hypothetical protein
MPDVSGPPETPRLLALASMEPTLPDAEPHHFHGARRSGVM